MSFNIFKAMKHQARDAQGNAWEYRRLDEGSERIILRNGAREVAFTLNGISEDGVIQLYTDQRTALPFSVSRARMPGAKVMTRDGTPVTDWHLFEGVEDGQPLAAVVEGSIETYTIEGSYFTNGVAGSGMDLVVELHPFVEV